MNPAERILDLPDAAATESLGARIAARLAPGDCVCLWGGLGAGKTTLARGLIQAALGAPVEAPSPTYTLVQSYEAAAFELWHVDLYRLERPQEIAELGLEDAFHWAVTVIEWPERLGGDAPPERLDVRLEDEGSGGRRAVLVGHGGWRERIGDI